MRGITPSKEKDETMIMNYAAFDPKNPEFICRDEIIVIKQDGDYPRYSNIYSHAQRRDGLRQAKNKKKIKRI